MIPLSLQLDPPIFFKSIRSTSSTELRALPEPLLRAACSASPSASLPHSRTSYSTPSSWTSFRKTALALPPSRGLLSIRRREPSLSSCCVLMPRASEEGRKWSERKFARPLARCRAHVRTSDRSIKGSVKSHPSSYSRSTSRARATEKTEEDGARSRSCLHSSAPSCRASQHKPINSAAAQPPSRNSSRREVDPTREARASCSVLFGARR